MVSQEHPQQEESSAVVSVPLTCAFLASFSASLSALTPQVNDLHPNPVDLQENLGEETSFIAPYII